jgi:hypothetical protein
VSLEPVPKLNHFLKPVGREGLEGREAAAPAAEPPESPVFAKQKCARMITVFILEPTPLKETQSAPAQGRGPWVIQAF